MKVSDYKSKKKNLSGVSFLIIIIISLISSYFLWQYLTSDIFQMASLQIDNSYEEATVFIDSKEKGTTPTIVRNITQGNHLIEITKPNPFYVSWSQRVLFTSGQETYINRQLGPTSYFSSGEIVYYEEGSTGLSIVTTPDEVSVTIDGQEMGKTPLFLPTINTGVHKILLLKDGYEGKSLEVKVKNKYVLYVSVDLFPLPVPKTEEVLRTLELSDYPLTTIITRSDWGVDDALGNYSNDTYAPVSSMSLYDLSTSEKQLHTDTKGWIQGIYYYDVMYLGLSDLDWHFFIDPDGIIYEGKKGGEEITLENRPVGEVRVGYLGRAGEGLTEIAAIAFESLQKSALTQRQNRAEIVESVFTLQENPDAPIKLEAQKKETISVVYKNIGNVTWYDHDPKKVYLRSTNDTSLFYTAENWVDMQTAEVLPVSFVGKDQEVRFEFEVTGPNENGEHLETFALYLKNNDQIQKIDGSDFTVKLEVTGGVQEMVLIKETGTGFLNVRNSPSFAGAIIDRVIPGEKYLFIEEQGEWYKIKLNAGIEGWIAKQYGERVK